MYKDNNVYKLSCFSNLCPDTKDNKPLDPVFEVEETQLKLVLDEIFSVDPVSGLPKGDIQYYMSSDGNPQVKLWLENNLLCPRMKDTSSVDGLTDDIINEFSRLPDESVNEYQDRLKSLYDSAKAESVRLKNLQDPNPE